MVQFTEQQKTIMDEVRPYIMSEMEVESLNSRLDMAEEILEDYFNESKITESELQSMAIELVYAK